MSQLLTPVLSRWEVDPPTIHAREARDELKLVFGALRDRSILRQTTPAGSIDCTECGERREVRYITDASGEKQGYICCSDCGVSSVPPGATERWNVDTKAFLSAAFAGVNASLQERVAGQLWQVGKANWAGRSREVWFVRAFRRGRVADALKVLEGRPKAILFAPTEAGAERWRDATANLVIAMESALAMVDGAIHLDVDYVEGRIVDAGMGPDAASPSRTKRRASRSANIELLKNAMIEHLRAARDHAYAAKERTGQPELLPRPLRKDLGVLTGLKKDQVTKCFQDADAAELNLYWEIAADLDQIMRWKGPVKRGRAS